VHSERRDERNVIPRWRPLVAIEKRDLASAGRFAGVTHTNTVEDFTPSLEIWRAQGDLAAASDILDAAIITSDRRLLAEAARIAERNQAHLPPRLRDALASKFEEQRDPLEVRRAIAHRETDDTYLYRSVQILKRTLRDSPRDALSYLEIARLYTILGQFEKSEEMLYLARVVAPDDRVILRATLQFYDIVAELEEGLRIIRSSDRLKFDPWIQSAEIATSTLLGKTSRSAKKHLIPFAKDGLVPREATELAMAMATLERSAGVKERKFFQLVAKALPNSTENGFAQAVWLSDQSSRDFQKRFPEATPASEAYEARVQLAVEERDFAAAIGYAQLWVEDQPFSVDAIIEYLNLCSVHSSPDVNAVQLARRSLGIHADNWHVLNACCLALTEARDFEFAEQAVSKLEREVPQDNSRAFVEAARGLLAFAEGDFQEGRIRYERASQIAIEGRRQDLLVDAAMFWFRCEAVNGLTDHAFAEKMKEAVEKALKRVSTTNRSHLQAVWYSVSLTIEKATKGESIPVSDKLEDFVSNRLPDPDLFAR
jgi:tetratricopeptide (TPR) repeat protein